MHALIEELVEVLEQENSQYSRLLPLLQAEKRAALDWNMQALTETIMEKQVLMGRIACSEHRRDQLLARIATQLHRPEQQIKLSELVEKARGPLVNRLSSLQDGLKSLAGKIRRANDENRLTVEHCLSLVHNSLAFWWHWTAPAKVYSVSGVMNSRAEKGHVLSGSI